MMKLLIKLYFVFLILLLIDCGSAIKVTPEPVLNRVRFNSKTICPGFSIYCSENATGGLVLSSYKNEGNGERKVYLTYNLSQFDSEIPVGFSLKINGTYYLLNKFSTEYGESNRITSEIPDSLLGEIQNAKSMGYSFSNRKHTINEEFSEGVMNQIKSILLTLKESVDKENKLQIVK